MEDFYRWVRTEHDLLMDGDAPAGGRWNLDRENREPPPRDGDADAVTLDVRAPWRPAEEEIDDEVRRDLDRWERRGDVSFTACCLATVLGQVRDTGWTHHIPRLMVLGGYALQRGWHPAAVTDWFHRSFVDGYDWVMLPNVVGMSQYADGGRMTTKPYTTGGAYIDRNRPVRHLRYRPDRRTGAEACPYTAGYWAFLHRHRDRLARQEGPTAVRTRRKSGLGAMVAPGCRCQSGAMTEHQTSDAPADGTTGTTVHNATVALVTGAAHGIGFEVARQLARRGIDVLVGARDPGKAATAVRGLDRVGALPVPLDITDQASVDLALRTVEETKGRLDILVNNAAAHPDWGETATSVDLDSAAKVMEVDLFGTWRMTISALGLLRRSPSPRVVIVSSGAGSHADERYGLTTAGGAYASHAIGKAAVNALTAALAAGLADAPVMVNAVCPDVTATVPGAEARGARPVEESAPGVVWAATLPDDGPRGGFYRDGEPLGW